MLCGCGIGQNACMSEINLTNGKKAVVSAADLGYVLRWNWTTDTNGYVCRNYRDVHFKLRKVYLHRDLLRPGPFKVDHRNGDRLDNQRRNLRIATNSQNAVNSRLRKNKSGHRGVYAVSRPPGYFKASIRANGRFIGLGYFSTREQAATAYKKALKKYFGAFSPAL